MTVSLYSSAKALKRAYEYESGKENDSELKYNKQIQDEKKMITVTKIKWW